MDQGLGRGLACTVQIRLPVLNMEAEPPRSVSGIDPIVLGVLAIRLRSSPDILEQ